MAKKKAKKFSSFLENPIDYTLLITVLLLLTIGLIMVLSASSPTSISESGKSYKYFAKQAVFAGIGIVAMAMISNRNNRYNAVISAIRISKIFDDNFLCRNINKR